ncbi:nucleoside/nucleotide kinase family protein [Aeromicrobium sp. UC242_57]|uniref:nucleoside/nucleotide kinase family protein n=1 Tax=Aeromicrobium sp. UC242_57 TaxID=3374624 RepID=UPI0037A2A0FA
MTVPDLDALADRARNLDTEGRTIVGIGGAPGTGKSTLAKRLTNRLNASGTPAIQVPMDGFHLADVALRERRLLDRKGAPETFDAHGYLALLRRIRTETQNDVMAPTFEREIEQPIAGAITIPPAVHVVITEGNYLLDLDDPWPEVTAELDEVWFIDLDDNRRRSRLVDRHVKHGKSRDEAQAWVDDVDEPNAIRVATRREAAHLVIKE